MDFKENLSKLTTIPSESINKLSKYINLIHSNNALESLLSGSDIIEVDIFEGKLIMKLDEDTLHYKFIPSDEFNKLMVDTITNKQSKLVTALSDRVKNTLINWRKDLL